MTDADSRAWWQDGVLGRLEPDQGTDLSRTLRQLATDDDCLGLDGLILRPAPQTDGEAALSVARDVGLRILIELPSDGPGGSSSLTASVESWLEKGADGVSIEIGGAPPPEPPKVTRLFGAGDGSDSRPLAAPESARQVIDRYDDRLLVGRRANDAVAPPPRGPHLVIETNLSRRPWRAATLGQTIEDTIAALPPMSWPGYEMGAPRRGPFAVGLSVDDALACSAALHLTLRGTPCIDLSDETELPANGARRRWYRRLIDLRRRQPGLHRGDFRRIRQEKSVFGYLREYEAERFVVLLNLGRRTRSAHLPTGFSWTTLLATDVAEGHRFSAGEISLPGCGVLIARAGTPQSRSIGGSGQRRATGP